MLYINGRPTFTSPTIQGTVDPGTGLTMPAFTLGGAVSGNSQDITALGSITGSSGFTLKSTVNNSYLQFQGATGGPGAGEQGATLNLYGSAHAGAGGLEIYTPTAGGATSLVRLTISGNLAAAVATWANITHTGLVMSGAIAMGTNNITGLGLLQFASYRITQGDVYSGLRIERNSDDVLMGLELANVYLTDTGTLRPYASTNGFSYRLGAFDGDGNFVLAAQVYNGAGAGENAQLILGAAAVTARFGVSALAPSAHTRGGFYVANGGAGVADILYWIAKNAADAYIAVQVGTG